MSDKRRARYECRVHARNRHAGYGTPVSVLATSTQDAVNRAVAIGWSGRPKDARVTIDSVHDEPETSAIDQPLSGSDPDEEPADA